MPQGVGYPLIGQPAPGAPTPQFKPTQEFMAKLALQDPDLAASMMASQGMRPPQGPLEVDIREGQVAPAPVPQPKPAGSTPQLKPQAPVPQMKPDVQGPPQAAAPPAAAGQQQGQQGDLGAALAGIQAVQQQRQPMAPAVGPQASGLAPPDIMRLVEMMRGQQQPQGVAPLGAFLAGRV